VDTRAPAAGASLHVSTELRDRAWDDLLASIPGTHFEQTSGWGAVKASYGWEVLRITATVESTLVGGVQVLVRRLGRFGKIGYVSRGPIAVPGCYGVDRALAEEVCRIASSQSWLYCVFEYPYQSHALAAEMAAQGFFPHLPGVPPSGLLTATTIVDLAPDCDDLLARMDRHARKNIKRALASGLTVVEGGLGDLPRFRQLMEVTCARRGSAPTPPQDDYFERLWEEFGDREWVKLFLVKSGNEVVSGVFAFALSDTVRLWKSGWSGAHADKRPNHLMFWESFRWAKAHGFSKIDLVWVRTEDAQQLARNESARDGFSDGTTFFKMGFGGALCFPPPVQSRFFHPLCRAAYRLGGARALSSNSAQVLVSRYWSHVTGRQRSERRRSHSSPE
jgi:lipid II:glycine glycyltransferase (peptidoglycan interpeptide bridge formation enzyme)